MPARTEVLGDRTRGGKEPLGVAWRFKPLQVSLPLAGRLVGVLRPIIEIPVLTMFHPWKELPFGDSIALEFVGDAHARYVGQAFQELAKELRGRFLVPTAVDQDIQHVALLIHRPPQILMLALDGQKHFIHLPLVAGPGTATTELIRILLPEFATPFANSLVGDDASAFR